MTREEVIKHWDVIKAFKEGEEIEYYSYYNECWEYVKNPLFNLCEEYRVKPEPIFKDGEPVWVRSRSISFWKPAVYKRLDYQKKYKHQVYNVEGYAGYDFCKKWDDFPNN